MINAFRRVADGKETKITWGEFWQEEAEAERKKQQDVENPENWIVVFYQECEKRNLDYIGYLGEEIGLMAKLKEKYRQHERIPGYCHYFINFHICEIEELYAEIEEYGELVKGLKKLSR